MAQSPERSGLAAPVEQRVIDDIPVHIRRNPRRRSRIGLTFDPAGFVVLDAPPEATGRDITRIIREHRRWLLHRLNQAQVSGDVSSTLRHAAGEIVHYCGQAYELNVTDGPHDRVHLRTSPVTVKALGPGAGVAASRQAQGREPQIREQLARGLRGTITVVLGGQGDRPGRRDLGGDPMAPDGISREARVRALLNDWYSRRADDILARQLLHFRDRLPWLESRVPFWRHRFMRSQWGSCSRSGRIALNTHLVKVPARLARYVVLHELCHLQHLDHSKRFYALMAHHMPEWQDHRAELGRYLPLLLQG